MNTLQRGLVAVLIAVLTLSTVTTEALAGKNKKKKMHTRVTDHKTIKPVIRASLNRKVDRTSGDINHTVSIGLNGSGYVSVFAIYKLPEGGHYTCTVHNVFISLNKDGSVNREKQELTFPNNVGEGKFVDYIAFVLDPQDRTAATSSSSSSFWKRSLNTLIQKQAYQGVFDSKGEPVVKETKENTDS